MHVVDGHAEQEEVLRPGLLAHFDVRAVEGADGQRAVHHELHVPGARRLLTGGRDLLGQVGGRVDQLTALHVEVGQEGDLETAVDVGVVVDRLAHRVDELDDQLGDVVAGRGLAAENESARGDVEPRVLLEPVVQGDDVQRVEVLALVLVNALDLNVEHPVRVELDARLRRDQVRQPGLVLPLDRAPALLEGRIVGVSLQTAQLLQVHQPAFADGLVEQGAQTGVGQADEAPRGDAVGLVEEPIRPHLVEVFEDRGLDQLGVHRRDAVDGMAADGGQMGHSDALRAVLADQRHPPHPHLVAGEPGPHFVEEPAVDLVDDLEMAGEEPLEHGQRPGLQRLGQQGVVGVGEGLDGDVPGLVPGEVPLVDQQPHQFGHRNRRVSVVELHSNPVGQLVGGHPGEFLEQVQDVLQRARHEEVLLQQP